MQKESATNMQEWPADFLERMKKLLKDDYDSFLHGLSVPSPVSIRLNPFKQTRKFINNQKVEWCDSGRYLLERPSFTFDPLFHAGTYYVQEASSMFLESAFHQCFPERKPLKVLDLCAAPGGKSTHLISLLPEGSILISNEIIPQRNKVLRQNIVKWGDPNVIVTQQETDDFFPMEGYFDLVLVDAPCSGEGLFRRDPDAAKEWSEQAVEHCSFRQGKILESALRLLAPGGILIYCTCTFEISENEDQIDSLLQNNSAEFVELICNHDEIENTGKGLRFYPHRSQGEGFFISALRKTGGEDRELKNVKALKSNKAANELVSHYLKNPLAYSAVEKEHILYAIPEHILPLVQFMEKKFYIRQAGIRMGEMKGKELVPSYDLAMSTCLREDLPIYNFSHGEAIKYLRCDTVNCPDAEKGWTLAAFEGFPLGWMKVLDNRVNNYFPKEWRILKEYIPS